MHDGGGTALHFMNYGGLFPWTDIAASVGPLPEGTPLGTYPFLDLAGVPRGRI